MYHCNCLLKIKNGNKVHLVCEQKSFQSNHEMYLLVQLIPFPSNPVLHSQCTPPLVEFTQVALTWHIVPLQVFAIIYKNENKGEINKGEIFSWRYQMYLLVQLIPSPSNPILHSQCIPYAYSVEFTQVALMWHIVPLQLFAKIQSEKMFTSMNTKIFLLNYQTYLLVQLIPFPSKPVLHLQCILSLVEFTQVALRWHIVPLQVFAKK